MESSASWDDTQKLIDANLYIHPQSPGADVIKALMEKGLLKISEFEAVHAAEVFITDEANRIHQLVMAGYSGRSASGQIYTKLQAMGVI
jgi:hypothetical protein